MFFAACHAQNHLRAKMTMLDYDATGGKMTNDSCPMVKIPGIRRPGAALQFSFYRNVFHENSTPQAVSRAPLMAAGWG